MTQTGASPEREGEMDDNTTYLVGVGGEPRDSYEEYTDLDDAEVACLEMAERQAECQAEDGADPVEVSQYENGTGDDIERGACPDGDSGGYWPHIEIA